MSIRYHSAVIFTDNIETMKEFYEQTMGQSVQFDFGGSVIFDCGLTIWELKDSYPLSKALGNRDGGRSNESMEICFESDEFEAEASRLKELGVKPVHDVTEEEWGQKTIRFYDPDGNIIEIGETMPFFCRRLYCAGLSAAQVSNKTGIPKHTVDEYLKWIK